MQVSEMLWLHSVSQIQNICPWERDFAYNSALYFLEQIGTISQTEVYKKQIKFNCYDG